MIKDVSHPREFQGVVTAQLLSITHLLLVDDIPFSCNGLGCDITILAEIMRLFVVATRMVINVWKSSITVQNFEEQEIVYMLSIFPYEILDPHIGFNYISFHLKLTSIGYWLSLRKV